MKISRLPLFVNSCKGIYYFSLLISCAVFLSCSPDLPEGVAVAYEQLPEKIDFNFHVRPILSDRCYACHGPDENARKAEFRLDLEETAFAKLASGNGRAFVAGKPGSSECVERILSDDPELMMPPPESNLALTEKEKAIIVKWIEQGAEWKKHWAFSPPRKPASPVLYNQSWPANNVVDHFIFKKLEDENMEPSAKADQERLLRRVCMDLTGLPPAIEEMESFLTDDSPTAYEKVVDRLLASDAAAERLAMDWMDLSRYADSHGLHADGWRMMWPWRDWVIQAFKDNMPYDQFVTWQLAGDLLPNATKEQKLATAFHRNHPMTAEGGAIDEEFRVHYVFDRAETTATAFLGLTLNCARCHDHKFDPVSQKEYYQFTAFFNNVKELGMTGDDGNYGPMLPLADPMTEEKLQGLQAAIGEKEQALKIKKEELAATKEFIKKLPANFKIKDRSGHFPLDELRKKNKGDGYLADDNRKSGSPGKPILSEGKIGKSLQFTGEFDELYLDGIKHFEVMDPFTVGLWVNTTKRDQDKTQVLLGTAGEKNNFWRGWDLYLDGENRLNARLIHSLPHNYVHVVSHDSIARHEWAHVAFSYDGSGIAAGIDLFIDGQLAASDIVFDQLYKSIHPVFVTTHKLSDRPIRVAKSYRSYTGESGSVKGRLDDIQFFERELTELEIAILALPDKKADFQKEDHKSPRLLNEYWIANHPAIKAIQKELYKLRSERLELMNPVDEVMVMEEMPQPRPTFAYNRGEYDAPMYEVGIGTPKALLDFSEDYPKNRLGLAKWLFLRDNPLTARVTVNRYWQMIFGQGLVETPQDFGVQGALPTHPELLDWLAVDFMENQWDVKKLLKTMVMSHSYQQSSEASKEEREKDPENLLLARGASYRLPAEMIRDNALAASGLLVQKVGGESVRPYQPKGLWIDIGNFSYKLLTYKENKGDSLYRRSLYTFVRRTSPHPAMTAFDAPNRDVCTVKRESTNTPLQALVLLNDPQFVEAARILAERMQTEGGEEIESQIQHAFRLSTGRQAKASEIQILKGLFENQLAHFQKNPKAVKELLSVGEYPQNKKLDQSKTAALAIVASTLINHDEAYMKR